MLCPYCYHENIDGVDACERCLNDLTDLDEPATRSALETSIIKESLAALKPREPVFIAPEAPVSEAISKLCEYSIGCLLVYASGELMGIISERDVLLRIAGNYQEMSGRPVSEFMTPDPVTLDAGASIAFALNRMATGDFRHLPVTTEGRVVGIVSVKDILNFLSEQYPDLIRA